MVLHGQMKKDLANYLNQIEEAEKKRPQKTWKRTRFISFSRASSGISFLAS